MVTPRANSRQPTKQRLLDAGVRLFSEKGFRETTVGDIEGAVGLQPRRGALYRHFSSKEALLEAALEQHLESIADPGPALEQLPAADRRAEALTMGRWLLAELDREKPIVRILEQDGDRLPALRDSFRRSLVDAGYVVTAGMVHRWLGDTAGSVDVEAVSAVLLGAVVNYRRSTWTFGASPLGIDDERFLSTRADLCITAAQGWRTSGAGRGHHPPRR
ncbi:MAG: TetR/AcrR family transcriptional regulator [Acidimicrobiales bacterium]